MEALVIVLIVLGALVLLLFIGGFLATRRRARLQAGSWGEHIRAADEALQEARAADKGWDRGVLENTARKALSDERPGFTYDELHLVLVDDRPGVAEDRAHLVAVGPDGEARVVLSRRDGAWAAERVE